MFKGSWRLQVLKQEALKLKHQNPAFPTESDYKKGGYLEYARKTDPKQSIRLFQEAFCQVFVSMPPLSRQVFVAKSTGSNPVALG